MIDLPKRFMADYPAMYGNDSTIKDNPDAYNALCQWIIEVTNRLNEIAGSLQQPHVK